VIDPVTYQPPIYWSLKENGTFFNLIGDQDVVLARVGLYPTKTAFYDAFVERLDYGFWGSMWFFEPGGGIIPSLGPSWDPECAVKSRSASQIKHRWGDRFKAADSAKIYLSHQGQWLEYSGEAKATLLDNMLKLQDMAIAGTIDYKERSRVKLDWERNYVKVCAIG